MRSQHDSVRRLVWACEPVPVLRFANEARGGRTCSGSYTAQPATGPLWVAKCRRHDGCRINHFQHPQGPPKMTTYGYARVSTDEQTTDPQERALTAAGVDPRAIVREQVPCQPPRRMTAQGGEPPVCF